SGGEGSVAEPAAVGRGGEENRNGDEQSAEQVHPVAEGVEARERDVTRADLQGNQEVEERRRERHDREEDHGRPVHREELVVKLSRDEMLVRRSELGADDHRLDATENEETERGIE